MGWLRDLMQVAGLPSYGALARAALAHKSWPVDSRVQQRSLATMLSRFDRGVELEWLSDRPAVQQVLADLLDCPVGDLRAPLLRKSEVPQVAPRVRLEGLPSARGFDFAQEPLPPGIPETLVLPASWHQLLWLTRPGDGRTVARQWLDIRGRAETSEIFSSSQLLDLPRIGPPLFIEAKLESAIDPTAWNLQRPTCIAIDAHAFDVRPWVEAGWRVIASPPIESSLDSIVLWVAQRLSSQVSFEVESTAKWLRETLVADGTIETFGDVVGWCGLIADQGLENTCRRGKSQNLTSIVKRMLAPLAKARESRISAMGRRLPELLVSMAERSLLVPNVDWLAPRALEAWVELLPEEERVGPDLDWMKIHLTAASKAIRAQDVERAAARFPPGAHRWLALLRDSGLLRPVDEGKFALRPHYLARLSRRIADGSLIQASSAVWGAALLHAQPKASIWSQLRRRAETSPESLIDSVLEDLDEESPGSVLALEATVVALGLGLLGGQEVPVNAAEQLLDESSALAVCELNAPPSPRIGLGGCIDGVDSRTLWWLAVLALSEMATQKKGHCDPCLDPWHQSKPPASLARLLDNLLAQSSSLPSPRPPWAIGAFLMLERLRQTAGAIVDDKGDAHPMHAPGIVLDEVQHGVLEWRSLAPLVESDILFEVFQEMAELRRVATAVWADGFWRVFSESNFDLPTRNFVRRHLSVLGPHVPVDLGAAWLEGTEVLPCDEVLASLSAEIVFAWLDRRDMSGPALPAIVAQNATEDVLDKLLVDLDVRDEVLLPILWGRVPHRVVTRIQRFRVMVPDKAARWIDAAPAAQSAALFKAAALDDWLKASGPLLMALRRYCARCITERVDDWQLAYNWLVRIERILRQSPN